MKLAEKTEARQLRENGLSIKQIAGLLNVSKGSMGREHARLSRLKNIASQKNKLFQKCRKDILPLSRRDMRIAGLMLYAGEGRKVWDASSQAVELTSSEPDIIRVFINNPPFPFSRYRHKRGRELLGTRITDSHRTISEDFYKTKFQWF